MKCCYGDSMNSEVHCILRALFVGLQAFGLFDTNGDGLISRQEVGQALQRLGVMGVDVANTVQQYDTNHDGQIDYREFVAMMI